MTTARTVLAVSAALVLAGCLSDPEGSRCNPDHTCGQGLVCDDNDRCVHSSQPSDAGGDAAGSDGGTASPCGNGRMDAPEACDDGNTSGSDGCSATCAIESGFTCAGAPSVCQKCGNGKREGTEACDDGNTSGSDGCSATCAIEPGFTCSGIPSACSCLSSKTNCGGTCVDLGNDASNCGACGYKVLRGRTCVSGKPTPSWVPMANLPSAAGSGGGAMTWTGRKYVAWGAGTQAYAYTLETDTWARATAYDPPAGFTIGAASARVVLADRKQVFIWPTDYSSATNAALLLDESGAAPSWTNVTTTGAPSARSRVAQEYDGSNVYVMFGDTGNSTGTAPDGGRYNLASRAWTPIGVSPFTCGGSGVRYGAIAASGTSILAWPNMNGNGGPCDTGGSFAKLSSGLTWSTPTLKAAPWSVYPGWLSTGDKVYKHGGCIATGNVSGGVLIDLANGNAAAVAQPAGLNPGCAPYMAWTGNAIIVWGGSVCNSSGAIVTSQNGGSVGVVSGTSIAWTTMPTFQQPSARASAGAVKGNTQHFWTGAEFIVSGGGDTTTSTLLYDGARYQPPVGCVCPGPATGPLHSSACDGVTGTIPACAP